MVNFSKFLPLVLSLVISTCVFAIETVDQHEDGQSRYSSESDPKNSEVRRKYLETKIGEEITVDRVLDMVLHDDTQLIALGETHSDFSGEDYYLTLLAKLKKKYTDLDCLFVEIVLGLQKNINEYLEKQKNYEKLIVEPFKQQRYEPLKKELLDKSEELNLKVLAVDYHFNFSNYSQRNAAMSNHISKYFTDGTCKRGVFITGSSHLSLKGKTIGPVDNVLRQKGLRVKSFKIIRPCFTKSGRAFYSGGSPLEPRDCDWEITPPNKNIGFLTPAPSPVMYFETSDRPIYWHEFDGVLVIPKTQRVNGNQSQSSEEKGDKQLPVPKAIEPSTFFWPSLFKK